MVLVPSDRHAEHVLATAPPDGGVFVFRRFLERLVQGAIPGWSVAAAEESRLATRLALDRVAEATSLAYPSDPVDRVRWVEAIDRAMGTLRRAGVTPHEIGQLDAPRLQHTGDLLAEVDAILGAAKLVDRRALGHAAARILRTSAYDHPGAIDIVGMARFDEDDLTAIDALHDAARRIGGRGVVVHLPRLAEHGEAIDALADSLEERWGARPDGPEIQWEPAPSPRIELVVDAQSPVAEARAVARAVLDAATGAAPFDAIALEDIAVVVPDLDAEHLDLLREAFAEAGLPVATPRARDPLASPEATALLGLFEMAAGTVTRDHVIDLLTAPGLHSGTWTQMGGEGEAAHRATRLAHRLREVPVIADRDGTLLVESLRARVEGRPDDAWMPAAVERLLESVASLRAPATRASLAERVLSLFDRLKLGQPSARELGRAIASSQGALDAIAEGSTALRALRECVRRLRDAALRLGVGDRPEDPGELLADLSTAITSTTPAAPGAAARAGAVRIVLPAALAGQAAELAVITRLSADRYGQERSADPWLLDASPALPSSREAELAWALSSARRAVLTSARESPEEAAPEPHALLAAALAAGAPRRSEPISRLHRDASVLDARGEELAKLAGGWRPPADLMPLADAERARLAFFLDPSAVAGRFTGSIEAREADHVARCVGGLSPEHPIAVTAIERAAICPFAGFARRVLGVAPFEDAEEAAGSRDRGTQIHRALHAAFVATELYGGASDEEILARARRAAERAVGLDGALSPLRRETLRQSVEDALAVFAHEREDAGFRATHSEQRFGRKGRDDAHAWPPLALREAPGEPAVWVEGQIDRVDRSAAGQVRVVDVKTGRPPRLSELGRTSFQLPLYAAITAEMLDVPDVTISFVRVRPGGRVEVQPRPGAAEAVSRPEDRQTAARAAQRAVLRLWSGDAPPRPASESACAYCDARDVCRRPAVMPIEEDAEEGA